MNPILVTGAQGQLGRELLAQLGDRAFGTTRTELDLANIDSIGPTLRQLQPAMVINCAAYTAVDQAETDRDAAFHINQHAVEAMADACNQLEVPLVQVSSDYVFDTYRGNQPRTETDAVKPLGIYAQSKLQGEIAAAQADRHLIVRTCGLYGGGARFRNFVETMLRLSNTRSELKVVNDQCCTPSYCRDVASGIVRLIDGNAEGLVHLTNSGSTTWHEFAETIFAIAGRNVSVLPITTEEFGAAAPRPSYSVLDCQRFQNLTATPLPSWKDALARYLAERSAT
ncbi:dTDP-4-dehydrorhamnose reductase [Bremerella sp. JC817]|uniref:dTDP-4-dehydrorhamnose reductase n=1 Tax=Bremerella sp. JC817 TaxID=3231756 RepID=UPI0034592152